MDLVEVPNTRSLKERVGELKAQKFYGAGAPETALRVDRDGGFESPRRVSDWLRWRGRRSASAPPGRNASSTSMV